MQTSLTPNLKPFHTFAISQTCSNVVEIHSIEQLIEIYQSLLEAKQAVLFLGKGSNVLFTDHFDGTVLLNRLMGIEVVEGEEHWQLHINGGEDWPTIVEWSIKQGYAGLENLALIPGCSGSAPIQNIGAYGVEFQDVCEYVDILCLDSWKVKRLSKLECKFGYRDSIFKHELYQKAIVVAVGLKLAKYWKPNIAYGPLKSLDESDVPVTAKEIFNRVCSIRMSKLPDPNRQGNAGSFFKNPMVERNKFEDLQAQYPDIVGYSSGDKVKLAAGWLIDQCGLKGHQVGGAMVHPQQALVIVNQGEATSKDVIELAAYVKQKVWEKYQVELEHEVRFIGSDGETNLTQILESRK
ncbi:UDP-N-acetylmuramate dehydrogenase [Vibrio sonorensis]|uniref:UDP-N-acetylmuramate dehydrogenase n=1 Tax=Vibrio sonorensis TaxID=1004316 RepID=UPI001586998B|nr:UDP-N-acetylmuramate dehydrogenase [Vibrio sonorensis]